jgi:IS5 family transposase
LIAILSRMPLPPCLRVAAQTDPVLTSLDTLLEDDQLYEAVRTGLGKLYRLTLAHGRHSTPMEIILRLLLIKHLYGWSYEETVKLVADSLVLRWFVARISKPSPRKRP